MDIVIRIRDTMHDGHSSDAGDFLDAALAAVDRVKHSVPVDDGVSLVSVTVEPGHLVPDPQRQRRR